MKRLTILSLFALFLCNTAQAELLFRISWEHSTTREDGTVLKPTERLRYILYSYGLNNTTTAVAVAAIPGSSTVYDFKPNNVPKTPGRWCFHMTTMDTREIESKPSAIFCVDYKPEISKPNKPFKFKAS